MSKPQYHVALFSGGKDSTAMVLCKIERGEHLDEIVCCDPTMEWPAMYRHIEKVRRVVEAAGIKFTLIRDKHDFEWWLLDYPLQKEEVLTKREAAGLPFKGKGWPNSRVRWCTGELKKKLTDRYLRPLAKQYEVIQYDGIAADEQYRLERQNQQEYGKRHPLVEWGWTEADAMAYCRGKGYDWEGLYDIFSRVSCWCCPLQPLDELRKLRQHFPEMWTRLQSIDGKVRAQFPHSSLGEFKAGQSIENLDRRFALEDALTEAGYSIKNKAFFADLKRLLDDEVTVEEIIQERKTQP